MSGDTQSRPRRQRAAAQAHQRFHSKRARPEAPAGLLGSAMTETSRTSDPSPSRLPETLAAGHGLVGVARTENCRSHGRRLTKPESAATASYSTPDRRAKRGAVFQAKRREILGNYLIAHINRKDRIAMTGQKCTQGAGRVVATLLFRRAWLRQHQLAQHVRFSVGGQNGRSPASPDSRVACTRHACAVERGHPSLRWSAQRCSVQTHVGPNSTPCARH